MGPTLLLDKSSLQSFSPEEIHFIFKYFFINIPPILVIEILADLKKPSSDSRTSVQVVSQLSKKLLNQDSGMNDDYDHMILSELLGNKIKMSRRTMREDGKIYFEKNKKG